MNHKVLNKEAYEAERKLSIAYEQLAKAHSSLMITYLDYPDDTLEYSQERANYWFDCAEENLREAFKVKDVHVARYSENPEPYKRALGAIFRSVQDSILEHSFSVLCRLHKVDPDDARRSYFRWLNGSDERWS